MKRNQHKLFSVSKMIRQKFRTRSTDRSDSICRCQWLFTFCNRQNTLKLFQKVYVTRIPYGIWNTNDNIYYRIWNENLLSFEYWRVFVCVMFSVYESTFIQPILHKILMKLPLFIEFIWRFYWVHCKELMPFFWNLCTSSIFVLVAVCVFFFWNISIR